MGATAAAIEEETFFVYDVTAFLPHTQSPTFGGFPLVQEHDIGRFDARSSSATLYVVRLLCRIEEFITLVLEQDAHAGVDRVYREDRNGVFSDESVRTQAGASRCNPSKRAAVSTTPSSIPRPAVHNHAIPTSFSRLRLDASTLSELRRSRAAIRKQLDGAAMPTLQAWFSRAVRDHQVIQDSASRPNTESDPLVNTTSFASRCPDFEMASTDQISAFQCHVH